MIQSPMVLKPLIELRNRRRWCRVSRQTLLSRAGGFTLVEILVVLAIIGLVMSMVGPRVLGYLAESKVKTSRIQVESLASAVDLFYLDNGRYPTQSEGLSVLADKPADTPSWNGPYLKGSKIPSDPWGRPFVYRTPGVKAPYDIFSLGANGLATDDSTNVKADGAEK